MLADAFRWIRNTPSAVILAAQLAAVLAYPFLDGSTQGRAILGVVQVVVVLSAVRAVRLSPALSTVAIALGVPTMVFALWESVTPGTDWVVLTSAALHIPFYGFVSYAMIRYLFTDDVLTHDEVFATGAAFTVVAWGFAYLYSAVQVLWPGSFGAHEPSWFDLLFLSFTTLTNTGLADFAPVQEHARSAVMLEQIAGVFYLGLVVARIVGMAGRRHHADR
ncbi:ion channel [Nocardioides nematodiphilus]|uniref:ion channel n=1 Tax=Nocardioides nematodiphilus TaxID=2849669 RepID=UPI001CD9A015|nr:ion channel [Nocardioides nematodiphilus]MCA1982687.1 two pore domain potassium channel family protein [Nocardioides nematodiphilus]